MVDMKNEKKGFARIDMQETWKLLLMELCELFMFLDSTYSLNRVR